MTMMIAFAFSCQVVRISKFELRESNDYEIAVEPPDVRFALEMEEARRLVDHWYVRADRFNRPALGGTALKRQPADRRWRRR